MGEVDLLGLITELASAEDREAATRRAAAELGADEMIVLSRDPETDAYLPAAGSRKTLPGGASWRAFLATLGVQPTQRGELPAAQDAAPLAAFSCSNGDTAIILLGGSFDVERVGRLCPMLPMLGVVLRTQQALAIAHGELSASRHELQRAAALRKTLDETRRQHDRTLIELDAHAVSLGEARMRAEQATVAKDRFLAMLGHELRNPLSPIVTALELIRHRGTWSHEHEIMQRQVRHLLRLVDDLLDIARITGGKLVLARDHVEMHEVLAHALETSSPLLDERRHPIELDVAGSGFCVHGDMARLSQVFSNLITNAAKYSKEGSPIRIAARSSGHVVRVEVVDEGIGIDPAMLDGVFKMFEQQEHGLARSQGGLGLGLAIVRNLVDQHGGCVEALSEGQGCGSRFVVELPLSRGEPAARDSMQEAPVQSAPFHGKVLVVDDNADAASLLAEALEYAGFEVRTAEDGLTALKIADSFRPDLALLDIGLPVMDGYELARRLRAEVEPCIRLVAITGYGQESDRQLAMAAGFDVHIVKPVDWPQLERTLQALMPAPADAALS